ncbi:MAG: hypothetical protein Q8M92_02945, partial [Candidatus Subteraquimicrobiales bacterium]|nr:hypothetical protein [Candidatus Subteraquimicrobiales bacterium]
MALSRVTITVSPVKVDVQIPAGGVAEVSLTVLNEGDIAFEVSPYANDYIKHPDGSVNFFKPGSVEWSCADWFHFEPNRLEVRPGEERKINCLIEVPPNARTGSYNGVVFFEAVVGKVEGAGISG